MFSSSSLDIYLQDSVLYSNPYHHEDTSQQSLRGRVVINTSSVLKVKRIYLQFNGKLSMLFPAAIKKTRRNLVKQTVILLDQEKAIPISGHHIFPFEMVVPNDLPESFQRDFGKIKYTLKAVAETTFISSDLKSEVPVYIHRNADTWEEPTEEYTYEQSLSDKITCKVALPTTEYTPGEKFDVQISALAVDQEVRVTNANCTLKEFTHFRIPSKRDQTRVLVAEYMNRLSFSSTPLNADEAKTLVIKTPEDANFSCINPFVEIYHELQIRVYFVLANGNQDYVTVSVPINVVSLETSPEFDQLPMYHTAELPPPYKSCLDEVGISLSPTYSTLE